MVIYKSVTILLAIGMLSLVMQKPVNAYTMNNGQFILQMGNTRMSIKQPTPTPTTSLKDDRPKNEYRGENYRIIIGYDGYPNDVLTFSNSDSSIDFGPMSPTNPIVRRSSLLITSGIPYIVLAAEDHALENNLKDIIPDTSCDDGNCQKDSPSIWISNLTYGFGFGCDNSSGVQCSRMFADSDNYVPFSDSTKNENPQVIINGRGGEDNKSQITYKVNIPGTQHKGSYKNTVTYILLPQF